MKSFTKKLILLCTGMMMVSFIVVYFLFNILANNYIRSHATHELQGGMADVVTFTDRVHITMNLGSNISPIIDFDDIRLEWRVPENPIRPIISETFMPRQEFVYFYSDDLYVIAHDNFLRFEEIPDFDFVFQDGWTRSVVQHDGAFIRDAAGRRLHYELFYIPDGLEVRVAQVNNLPILQQEAFIPSIPPIYMYQTASMATGTFTAISQLRPISARPTFVNTQVIILDHYQNIVTPMMEHLSPSQRAQVQLITALYANNDSRFTTEDMVRARDGDQTFYISASHRNLHNDAITILMYADVSSAMIFIDSMNQILAILLTISALFTLGMTLYMSSRFKKAIARLSAYAGSIGRGNFAGFDGTFKDAEFAGLSASMEDMAAMLHNYESTQKQFFQNASHELRTPLMSIQGYAEGISGDVFDKNEAAAVILSEGKKMTGLVDELLYISRMDTNKEINLERVSLVHLVARCIDRIKPLAVREGIMPVRILLHVHDDFSGEGALGNHNNMSNHQDITLDTDYEKFERALLNLLSNAVRYAKTEIIVTIIKNNSGHITITVADDGTGIVLGDLPHIFERFYKGTDGNTGLGLAITKDIIKRLGGSITAANKNAPETGAVFTIHLNA